MLCFHVERFCLSCHGDALWADTSGGNRLCWLVLLLHVCMCPCAAHTNTHTHRPMYSTVPLKNGRCLLNLNSKEHCHPKKDTWSPQRTVLKKGRGTYTKYWRQLAFWALQNNMVKHLTYPNRWLDGLTETAGGFLKPTTITYTVHISLGVTSHWVQSAGCKRETSRHSTGQPLHTFKSCVFLSFFFAQNQDYFLGFENWTIYYLKPNSAMF